MKFQVVCLMVVGVFGVGGALASFDRTKINEEGMFPFAISYEKLEPAVDMSSLLVAPAGAQGRIRVADGHFVNDAGRVRLNGVNLTGAANFPTHAEAERLAARLAALGINCVRLHYFDTPYDNFMMPKEPSILLTDDPETQTRFNPEMLDRFDYMIAQFKKRGIYVNINLHVGRTLDARDGVAPGTPWANKGIDQWYPAIIEQEKKYAHDLLSHVNPYMQENYLKSPVVALVELNNEDALLHKYSERVIDRLVEPYASDLRARWNAWLAKTYGADGTQMRAAWKLDAASLAPAWRVLMTARPSADEVPLIAVDSAKKSPHAAKRDFYRFLIDLERAYWGGMRSYLRDELGLEAPVTGTQIGYTAPFTQQEMDFIDTHSYWNHPSVEKNWWIAGDAMVNTWGEKICRVSGLRVEGKPYTLSEYNHPYPNFFGAEGQPMIRAYGAFQDWDGIFGYTYNCRQEAEPASNNYFFSLASRTDVLAHFPACAAIFLRGDVTPGATALSVGVPWERFLERLTRTREVEMGLYHATGGSVRGAVSLLRRVNERLGGEKWSKPKMEIPEEAITNETGELVWDLSRSGAGVLTVNTQNVKLFTGYPAGRTFDLGGVQLKVGETKLSWATVSLLSRTGSGMGERGAAKLLLAATGLSFNQGSKFTFREKGTDQHCRGEEWGKGPVLCEGIPAEITLAAPAAKVSCFALDGRGARVAEVPVKPAASGRAVLSIDPKYRTVWYEVVIGE